MQRSTPNAVIVADFFIIITPLQIVLESAIYSLESFIINDTTMNFNLTININREPRGAGSKTGHWNQSEIYVILRLIVC